MPEIGPVLVPAAQIQQKVRELGEQITRDYAGEKLLLVGI
ncbi:MAG: hypoxanthine phosphoribosyltransferase, partial [Rubrobacter sp.]|nr:hypoxanthine phosphoribosyltransferase [Rubrobacter sp.]